MTLEQLELIPDEILTCTQVAPILKANPATLHHQAIEMPWLLGFPVIVAGNRVKIPKRAFIRFMTEGIAAED